ncbi:hypothetical protein SAY87_012457 [Trapa incisa]|uniref:Calmodulin-binding protein n=1 Tax=Trapa incisa TaxID=236973 RepID=A0AAN7GPD9_9MYRT|nr:hypothetical protein SAY87_012457 [Trapa incisa]
MFPLEALPDDVENLLEPIFRKWVREEVERSLSKMLAPSSSSGSSTHPAGTSQGTGLELRFVNELPDTVFTGSRIEAEDESLVEVELIDSRTCTRVTDGPLSSAKVSILVLNGDFHTDNGEDWTRDGFNSMIVRKREGRRPLITGELTISLQQGMARLSNIIFTDNSSWIRCRRFRLGARILQKVPTQVRVKEAATGRFIVKEHRGEVLKKHYPPQSQDPVWRLVKIAKDRIFHSRLASEGIHVVEDFLRLLETNESLLRMIIGQGVKSGTWEAIVAHARTCIIDDKKQFIYHSRDSMDHGLLLDSVYRVIKVTFDGHSYIPVDGLTPHQMALMQSLKREAYVNVDKLAPVKGPPVLVPPQPVSDSFSARQEEPLEVAIHGRPPLSDSAMYGSDALGTRGQQQQEVSGTIEYQPDEFFTIGDLWTEDFNRGIGFPGSFEGPAAFENESISGIRTSACASPASVWTPGNSPLFFGPSSDQLGGGTFPSIVPKSNFGLVMGSNNVGSPSFDVHIRGRNGRSRVAWCKVRAAFKFRSMRKVAARRRRGPTRWRHSDDE